MNPLISIVLCTYNGAVYLQKQLESLLEQSYQNFEIIICDDASTDNTPQLLASYASNEHIRIYYNKVNIGLTNNIEQALSYCKGDYLAFCDQDDFWEKDKLTILYDAIQDDMLIYSDSELVDENGEKMNIRLSQLRNMHTGNNILGFVFSNCVWGHTILIRSSLLEYVLPIPAGIPHDSWMGFVAACVNRIKYYDLPLNFYRQHQNSVTSTLPPSKHISSKSKKREEYQRNLKWINSLAAFRHNPNKPFFEKLQQLFIKKEKKVFVWSLFFFLLKHQRLLFAFPKKNFVSRLNIMRKLSRGIDLQA
jgi:glycosyltransferase involved in cell wall biosynthesis